jgi:hypothetical protein
MCSLLVATSERKSMLVSAQHLCEQPSGMRPQWFSSSFIAGRCGMPVLERGTTL